MDPNEQKQNDQAKWWLISDEDVQTVRDGLEEAIDFHPSAQTTRALHTLESGLHVTDAVPDDFAD